MNSDLKDTVYTEIYRNGSADHATGWSVGVEESEVGFYATASQKIDSEPLHERTPEFPIDWPFSLILSSKAHFPKADAAVAGIWDWLDENGARIVEEFADTGKVTGIDGYDAIVPISSLATTTKQV